MQPGLLVVCDHDLTIYSQLVLTYPHHTEWSRNFQESLFAALQIENYSEELLRDLELGEDEVPLVDVSDSEEIPVVDVSNSN